MSLRRSQSKKLDLEEEGGCEESLKVAKTLEYLARNLGWLRLKVSEIPKHLGLLENLPMNEKLMNLIACQFKTPSKVFNWNKRAFGSPTVAEVLYLRT